MEHFLAAVAQTLRNLGFEDAISDDRCVTLRSVRFQVMEHRKTFRFCGRTYRSGNVLQATLDLIQQLPELLARRDATLAARRREQQLVALNESLASSDICIRRAGNGYELVYRSADLEKLESVAKQIVAAEDIAFAAFDTLLEKVSGTVTFTSEGGFSLN